MLYILDYPADGYNIIIYVAVINSVRRVYQNYYKIVLLFARPHIMIFL